MKSAEIDLRVGGSTQYETRQDRDAHSASMGDGLQDALDLLEEVASS
jgi:hypothetical protein